MDFAVIIIMLVFASIILINGCGVWGIVMGIGAGMVGLFITSNTTFVWIGLSMLVIGIFWWVNKITKSPESRKQISHYTKQIRKDEQEYGVIDFTEKK